MNELLDFIISQANDNEKIFEENLILISILAKAKEIKKSEIKNETEIAVKWWNGIGVCEISRVRLHGELTRTYYGKYKHYKSLTRNEILNIYNIKH